MSNNNERAGGDVTAGLAAIRGAFWPMTMAMRMFEDSAELYAKNLRLFEEEIKTHVPVLATPKSRHEAWAATAGVSRAVGDASDKIADAAAEARDVTRAASGKIQAKVERNPLMLVLMAFGVGIWMGLISRTHG